MKKAFLILITAGAIVLMLTACSRNKDSDLTLSVGATPVPHAELLNLIKDDLAAVGVTLNVVEFTDYIQPNMAVMSGDIDANFFQHFQYLETNAEWSEHLVSVFGVHVEPFGLYSSKYRRIEDLPIGATIAIPNDPSNGGRALLLLQAKGQIKLVDGAGITVTVREITSNPKNFRFQELEAAQLPRSLPDVDAATINGNFALQAGFNPIKDSLIIEDSTSPYVNVLVVRKGMEKRAKIEALRKALLSDKVRNFIIERYDGGVAPIF
jgi:D-methionine transport system substrate-binding protein